MLVFLTSQFAVKIVHNRLLEEIITADISRVVELEHELGLSWMLESYEIQAQLFQFPRVLLRENTSS